MIILKIRYYINNKNKDVKMKNIINKIQLSFYGLMGMMATSPLMADTVGGQLKKINTTVEAGGNLLMWVVGVAGIGLMFMGIMGLKKYADDARSNPLMKPMIYLVAGGMMSGFTVLQSMFSETVTGTATDNANTGTFKASK
jgi:hypothetical protein